MTTLKKKRYFWPKYHEMSLRSLGKTPSSNLQKKHCKTFLKLHITCYLLCYLLSIKISNAVDLSTVQPFLATEEVTVEQKLILPGKTKVLLL